MLDRRHQEVFHKNQKLNLLKIKEKEVNLVNQIQNLEVNLNKEEKLVRANKRL